MDIDTRVDLGEMWLAWSALDWAIYLSEYVLSIHVSLSLPLAVRDALTKMKGVYEKNPQMGDPASVDPRIVEMAMNIEKLQSEVQKFEVSHHKPF